MSNVVHIRELLKFSPTELLDGLRTTLVVRWDDGKDLELTSKEIILNRYLLEVLDGVLDIPLLSNYSITNFYSRGNFVNKSINKMFETITKDIVHNYVISSGDKEPLRRLYKNMYIVLNKIYNELIYAIPDYTVGMNILDFVEVQINEELLKSMLDVKHDNTPDKIQDSYKVLDKVLTTEPKLKNNRISKGYIGSTFNANQVKQILAPRGFGTEINNQIFKTPIANSFCIGLNNMYELAVESRSAAKALFVSTKAIQNSEYFARELQLATMSIEKLVEGDCGSKEYLSWYVRPASDTHKPDLPALIGKYYLNEETGEEEEITSKHTHLVGKTIKLRSVLHCRLEDRTHVCSKCFGTLGYGLFNHTNLGHVCATSLTQKITQSILSTKHLVSSATSDEVVLDDIGKSFFNVISKTSLAFKKEILSDKSISLKLIVSQREAFGLKDLLTSIDVKKTYPNTVSLLSNVTIAVSRNDKEEYFPIATTNGRMKGSFTQLFLSYIQQVGYTINDNGMYVIDLSKWKLPKAIITIPQAEFSFSDLLSQLKSMFKHKPAVADRDMSVENFLQRLYDLVNRKLDVNLALLEVITYAFTVMDKKNGDYRLARNCEHPELAIFNEILPNRSLGGVYGWENVKKYILSPKSFNGYSNINHVMDVMIRPQETLDDVGID